MDLSTAEGRLRWAFHFASEDLVKPGDWLNAREDIGRFLASGDKLLDGGGFMAQPRPQPDDLSETEIRGLHEDARRTLELAARPPEWKELAAGASAERISTTGIIPLAVLSLSDMTIAPLRLGGQVLLFAHGPLRELFLLRLLFLLAQQGLENVKACPREECGHRLFWRVRRQRYCSRTCTNRAVFEAWKQTEKGRTRPKREAVAARERREIKNRQKRAREEAAKIREKPSKRGTR